MLALVPGALQGNEDPQGRPSHVSKIITEHPSIYLASLNWRKAICGNL